MRFSAKARLLAAVTAAMLIHDLCQAERVSGVARDASTQRLLYTEVHEFTRAADGKVLSARSRYLDAQGREIATKSLDYRANRYIPVYTMEVPAQRYAEGIRSNADPVVAFKQDGGREEVKRLAREPGLEAADSGFNHLLMDQMPRLLAGETVGFRLIVAGQTDRFRFRAKKVDELTVGQTPAVKLLVEPDSLLRLLVDPLELVYDRQGTRLISYRGVSNIIDPRTQQVYKQVVITYDEPLSTEPRSAQRAATAP